MRRAFLVALIALLPSVACGQAKVAAPASTPPPASAEIEERISRLEQQFSIVRDYNDDFLAVVLWTLGTVGGLTLLLIGFNWFQSSRTLRRELDALKAELNNLATATSADLSTKIDTHLVALEKKLKPIAAEIAEEKATKLRGNIGWLRSEVLELQYKRLEAESREWLRKDVPNNVLNLWDDLISYAIKLDHDWRISEAIDLLNAALDELKKGTSRLEAQDLAELEAAVEKLPDTNKSARAALVRRLAELHSK